MASAKGQISWVSLTLLPLTPWVLTGPNLHFCLTLNIFKSTGNHKHGMNKARSVHKVKVLTSTLHSHAVNKLNFQPLYHFFAVVAVPSLSPVWLFVTPWTAAHQSSLSFIISQFAQIHVHWVSDAIQPSHPWSSPSPAFSLSQHQSLSQWVSSSHPVAKVLELQHPSFQWIFRVDFL